MILLFGKKACNDCFVMKKTLESRGIKFKYFDIETAEGMAEAAYYSIIGGSIKSLPIIVVVDTSGDPNIRTIYDKTVSIDFLEDFCND